MPLLNATDDPTDIQSAFLYRAASTASDDSYEGQIETYSGGGYVANLGETLETATEMINNLESQRWIDIYTRALFVEFSVFNPSSSLANAGKILFEYTPDGSILWSVRTDIVQLYRYTGANGVIALVSEIGCAIFVLVITILEIRKIVKQRQAYFASFWNSIQIITLILFFVAVGLYTYRCLWTMWVVEDLMNNPGTN